VPTTDPEPYRLPRNVAPRRYDLTLSPDLADATFAGEARIEVEVLEPVDEIVLNALELDIPSADLIAEDGTEQAGAVVLDEGSEQARIRLPHTAQPGVYHLHLTFTGVLNDKLRGFYRSTFTDDDGTERVIATTQFESTDARRAFPCWDEPDRKAVFGVTLIVDDGLTAVSNGPVVEDDGLGDGKRQFRFADTMKMSTYLVAFVVGPLEATAPMDVDGTPLRVVCVPGKSHLADFALEIGAHSLRSFARYFGIPYPGAKLDLIALPDFAMGAMENLGAVTFRENLLLIDPDRATRGELERVADVVAHEVAHMWFGDLVTMKWWNGIWLNEAFATFMELLCVDDFRPEWDRWVTFGLTRGAAMVIDSLDTTRPIEFPVGKPEEAEGMFDVLTYQKGAGVLRMLEQYLGAEPFRSGIVRYIDAHQYGNTETTDLWDAIEAATGEPARATMDTWIFQGGYPIVSVETGDDAAQLRLSQRRFRYVAHDDDALWRVPVLIRASVGGEVVRQRFLLTEREDSVTLPGKPDWVVVNAGGWGVYRVRYAPELLRALTTDLASLDKLERFNLVSDTWASVLAGTTGVAELVELLRLFAEETDPAVWGAITSALSILRRVTPADARPQFAAFVRTLVRPQFERLGWSPKPGESELDGELRGNLIAVLGWHGADEAVLAEARAVHDRYLADTASVDPNVAQAVAILVARYGGEGEFQSFLDRWRQPSTPQEEIRYLYGLAEFPNPALARRALDLAVTEVRTQNGPFVIAYVLLGPENTALAWDFIESHWDELLARFTPPLLPRMLDAVASITDPALAARVRAFIAAHPLRSGQQTVEQAMERMDVHVAFGQRAASEAATAFDD
jgi:puromycin-sensitive aminopeptidase